MAILDIDKLHKKFERDGEGNVRSNLDAGRYNEKKAVAAASWLASLDAVKEENRARSNSELLERQVESAEKSISFQKWALGISVVAILVTAIVAFV